MDIKQVDKICSEHDNRADHLIGILQDVQAHYRYLPKHPIERVAQCLNIPLAQVFSVATFFRAFSLTPRGEKVVNVCMGTACHVRGAKRMLEELERDLGIDAGQTTKDMKVTLETVNCVGACALGPVIVVNEDYHGKMDSTKTAKLAKDLMGQAKR
ncbi:MAG: NAD(P)H-dependent oxidoreductase subunit E [Pseudomonadota bacterium]